MNTPVWVYGIIMGHIFSHHILFFARGLKLEKNKTCGLNKLAHILWLFLGTGSSPVSCLFVIKMCWLTHTNTLLRTASVDFFLHYCYCLCENCIMNLYPQLFSVILELWKLSYSHLATLPPLNPLDHKEAVKLKIWRHPTTTPKPLQ